MPPLLKCSAPAVVHKQNKKNPSEWIALNDGSFVRLDLYEHSEGPWQLVGTTKSANVVLNLQLHEDATLDPSSETQPLFNRLLNKRVFYGITFADVKSADPFRKVLSDGIASVKKQAEAKKAATPAVQANALTPNRSAATATKSEPAPVESPATPVISRPEKKSSAATEGTSEASGLATVAPADDASVQLNKQYELLQPLVTSLCQSVRPQISRSQAVMCVEKTVAFLQAQAGTAFNVQLQIYLNGGDDAARAAAAPALPDQPDMMEEAAREEERRGFVRLFRELKDIADDYQQQSWQSYDNEGEVCAQLEHMLSALSVEDADDAARIRELINEHFMVDPLVTLFLVDERTRPRTLLLQIYGALGALMPSSYEYMGRVLPEKIAESIIDKQNDHSDPAVAELLLYDALAIICFCADPERSIPWEQVEHLMSAEFVQAVVNVIEMRDKEGEASMLGQALTGSLLAVNMQESASTRLLESIADARDECGNLTHHLIMLINEANDPLNYTPCVKFMGDLFAHESVSGLFYPNDVKLIVDICIRRLHDFDEDNEERPKYLRILHGILKNCESFTSLHYKDDEVKERVEYHLESPHYDNAEIAKKILDECSL